MARRYSQIKRGAEYDLALDNYITYIKNVDTRPTKRLQGGSRGARRQTRYAAVRPFGVEMPAGTFAATRVGEESFTEVGSAVASRLFTSGANLTGASRLDKFRPAKAVGFRGTGAAAYVQSKVTKLFYLKYTGDSFGVPFGAISDTEEEYAGSLIVKNAIITLFGAADIKRVSITAERVAV